jgi:DNA-binding ferritin-like protein (Dps family)
LNNVREAVRSFALALGCDNSAQEFQEFAERIQKVADDTRRVYKEMGKEPLPFIVNDQPFKSEFGRLLNLPD